MLDALRDRDADFAFSNTRFIDDDGAEVGARQRIRRPVAGRDRAGAVPGDPLLALLRINVAVSTGNFVFRRSLLEKTGGMCAFRVCHDWDFILGASYFTPLVFVREQLYEYRVHRAKRIPGLRLVAHLEADRVIEGSFREWIDAHPALRDLRRDGNRFLEEVRRARPEHTFLPTALGDRVRSPRL